jgi:hypothetical protein
MLLFASAFRLICFCCRPNVSFRVFLQEVAGAPLLQDQ